MTMIIFILKDAEVPDTLFGLHADKVQSKDDLTAPLDIDGDIL